MTQRRFENGKQIIERWDRVFNVLSAEPRRQLIVSLLDTSSDRSVSLPEAAVNPNVPVDPESLRTELHHRHLPMLADAGAIDWEADPLIASRGPQFDQVAVVFEALQSSASSIPDELVIGCQRLEKERQPGFEE